MEKEAKKVIVTNRKAWHEYTIDETYDAGIVLVGTEVKSIRAGKVNLQDSFCRIENGEVWVHGMYIAPYEFANRWVVDPRRSRKLLLHRDEIDRLRSKSEQRGLTIVPLKVYFERGYAKLEIGIGRGKKLYDKREAIAKRDIERERRREIAGRE
ncbi:MAG TPA: SsrA-binding protein SmpB [Armatimonadota bacterium]|jgi:SsrA-binding protein|nr:SsrA-binding protein SmpB [Armatimonadota bacterium]